MTVGALIVFVVAVVAFGLFGIYAGYHREDDHPKRNDSSK